MTRWKLCYGSDGREDLGSSALVPESFVVPILCLVSVAEFGLGRVCRSVVEDRVVGYCNKNKKKSSIKHGPVPMARGLPKMTHLRVEDQVLSLARNRSNDSNNNGKSPIGSTTGRATCAVNVAVFASKLPKYIRQAMPAVPAL